MSQTRFTFDKAAAVAGLAVVRAAHEDPNYDPQRSSALNEFIEVSEFSLATFSPVWGDYPQTIKDLIAAAYAEKWVTGPTEPSAEFADDFYTFTLTLNGLHLYTGWQEHRLIVGRDEAGDSLNGEPAALDLLESMVSDLNAELARLDQLFAERATTGGRDAFGNPIHSLTVPEYGQITVYRSDLDGVHVVEIDTPQASEAAGTADGQDVPRLRVYVNDGPVWEHPPCPEDDDAA